MQQYWEEYIDNLNKIRSLTIRKSAKGKSFKEYCTEIFRDRELLEQTAKRNMELLRNKLFPLLDNMFEASEKELRELKEFAARLSGVEDELDTGLFCHIHRALLSYARLTKNRAEMIEHLYWLGIGHNNMNSKLIGLSYSHCEKYYSQMRLCFAEAAAYLKYFDSDYSTETKAYILRSRANMSLGGFKSSVEKIRIVKRTLMIFQDEGCRQKAPELPWDKYVYTIHRQMASSADYKKETELTPQDIEDYMESVYLIYETRLKEAEKNNEEVPIRPRFYCYVAGYYCGLYNFEEFLSKIEGLMNAANTSDYSEDSMYAVISMLAFYCQYLEGSPENIPVRSNYISSLNKRAFLFLENAPKSALNEKLFFYLRQLAYTYIETDGSDSYKDFVIKLQMTFCPSIFAHSFAVGRAASVLSGILIEEEPDYFDDIDFIREIKDFAEKKREIESYALNCGLLHDIGKMNFMSLYVNSPRQWFEDESEMARLHTLIGKACLEKKSSTARYAAAALGHHGWYEGNNVHGYPADYKRLECEYRQMVDVIGIADWLESMTDSASRVYQGVELTFEEAKEKAILLEGKRFSPMLIARLKDKEVSDKIKNALNEGRIEAYRKIYETEQ